MQTRLETIGALERRLNVAVPRDAIENEVAKRLARLAKNVKLPGFRPGKVPLKMVAQQYGPQVRSDVISDTVQATVSNAIRDQNLRIAGNPRIEPKTDGPPAEDQFEFSAVFEIYPEIRIGELSQVTITRPIAEVTPADVEDTIEVLRRQRATFLPATRPAAGGDRVIVDFSGRIDGVEFQGGQAKDFAINIGEGRMLPEFESAVNGMQAGETKQFALTFPADYHGKEVAGKVAEFSLTVHSVATPELPPVDGAFAKAFGIASGDLGELRAEITSNLELELKRKIEGKVKEQALGALRRSAELAVPRSLVAQEAQHMAQRMAAELQQQGMAPADIKLTPDMFLASAEERVALSLVVSEVVRAHGLGAKPEQVKALVLEAAQTYEQPQEVVRWHYEKPERLGEFETLAVERNVVDWVCGQARVQDIEVPFAELMTPART
jgi:trigger factor